jgi:hypothetical protein
MVSLFPCTCVSCPARRAPVATRRTPLSKTRCTHCGAVFRPRFRKILALGSQPGMGGGPGDAGVREPRRPVPGAGAGGVALPVPGTERQAV